MNIIPSITTTNREITKLQISSMKGANVMENGLFLTGIDDQKERIEFIKFLNKELPYMHCPLVHIRIDSSAEEINLCKEFFETKWFNLHGEHCDIFKNTDLYNFKDIILAENSRHLNDYQMNHFAGVCLDLSHYFEDKTNDENYIDEIELVLNKYPIYCNHISAVKIKENVWSEHIVNDFSSVHYLKKIPGRFFGGYSCLELENTIELQLQLINYIYNYLE